MLGCHYIYQKNNGIITLSVHSMVEQLYLFVTDNHKKGEIKVFFFCQNLIFDSVLTSFNVAISQNCNKVDQVRTVENFNCFRD